MEAEETPESDVETAQQIAFRNSIVLKNIYSYLKESVQDQISFRSLNASASSETLTQWRKSTTVVVQQSPARSNQPPYYFLTEFQNISAANDPNGLFPNPFLRYEVILPENNTTHLIPTYFGNRLDDDELLLLPLPRPVSNFWKLCCPHMTHLTLQQIYIENQMCLVNLLNALLFVACPSLTKLSLEPACRHNYKVVTYLEAQDKIIPILRPSLLKTFSFRVNIYHPAFNGWHSNANLQAIFGLMPLLTELHLEGTALPMLRGILQPAADPKDYIKLEKLTILQEHASKFGVLKGYVERVSPPLKILKASVSFQNDFGFESCAKFCQFFKTWAPHLTHLTLNVTIQLSDRRTMNYFTKLSAASFDNLTDFHLTFANDSNNISFDFRVLRKMPKLKVFRIFTNVFNGNHDNSRSLFQLRDFIQPPPSNPDVSLDPLYPAKYFEYPETEKTPGEGDILLEDLKEFSFRLNYKFGRYAIQQLRIWAENLRILEIVIDDKEDFLHFLGKEFQWWRNSLDKVILFCEKDLTDYDTITKAIRRKEGKEKGEERDVEIQFVKLAVGMEIIYRQAYF